jgi:YidC/Oxa1 family membrane protein insertase
MVRSWQLLDYHPWYRQQDSAKRVDLVRPGKLEYGFSFRAMNGKKVSSETIPFAFDAPTDAITVAPGQTVTVRATATVADGGTITRTYTFTGDNYQVQTDLTLAGMEAVIPQTSRFVTLEWRHGLNYQEENSVDESNNAIALVATNGELSELDAPDFNAPVELPVNGTIDYLATRNKYFAVAMLPAKGFDGSAMLTGDKFGLPDAGFYETYKLALKLPYRGGSQTHSLTLFAGPMLYDTLATMGLTDIINFGWKWIIKPIGEYFMLPTLRLIHSGIPNYGIAIILFALLMKALLYPLGITQMKSARKMQLVAPLMNEIREKYKDDNQTQQQEMMKLYSQYGINPAGGCLPLLLQMPFLYALYSVLNLNIELRQAEFLSTWLYDLSVPDVIFSLPFKLPLVNIDKFSGLALLMGATLFIQQKQAVTDPRQKALVYMMPVMMTLMFSSLPAGLNLYYFVFNIVAIGQTIWQTKFSKNQLTLADLRNEPKKESWLQRKMREAQEMAEAQGRSLPGQPPRNQRPGASKQGKSKRR